MPAYYVLNGPAGHLDDLAARVKQAAPGFYTERDGGDWYIVTPGHGDRIGEDFRNRDDARRFHRGLWLADEQIGATGLPRADYDAIYRGHTPVYSPDVSKSRDPHRMGGRVRFDAIVRDQSGRPVFSIGFYRGRNAKARALDKARECAARKLATGDWLEASR